MSYVPHRVQHMGWKMQAAALTDPVTGSGTPYYKFGAATKSLGNFVNYKQFINPVYRSDSRDPAYLAMIDSSEINETLGFVPVNAMPFYLALGQTNQVTDTKTITGIETGELPKFAVRWETSNGTDIIRKTAVDCKVNTLSWQMDFTAKNSHPTVGLNINARKIISASYAATMAPSVLYASEVPFYDSSNSVATWDGDSIKPELLTFSYSLSNQNRFVGLQNQNYNEWVLEGNRTHQIEFTMLRGTTAGSNMYTDFLDQIDNASSYSMKDVVFKMYQMGSATNYIKLSLSSVALLACEMNMINTVEGERPVYNCTGLAKSLSVEAKDGATYPTYVAF